MRPLRPAVRIAALAALSALVATLAILWLHPCGVRDGEAARATAFPPVVGPPRAVASDVWRLAPRFSPDGRWIVAAGSKFAGLWIVDPDGLEAPRPVSDEDYVGFGARWTAAGIETWTRAGRAVVYEDPLGTPIRRDAGVRDPSDPASAVAAWAQDDAVLVRRDGQVRTVSDGADAYFSPVLSPDGTAVAFEGLSSGLHVHDLVLGTTARPGPGNHPAWLPDSSGILYDVSSDDGRVLTSSDLWAFDRATGRTARLTDTPGRLEAYPSVSPDGRRVAFEDAGKLFVADLSWPERQ